MPTQAPTLTPDFNTACAQIRKLLSDAEQGDACARYSAGTIIAEMKREPGKYGEAPVKHLEKALTRSAPSLYRYARVAERWDEAGFLALLERRNQSGLPLTWRHFEVLSTVRDRAVADQLVEDVLAGNVTAHQLEGLVRKGDRVQQALPEGAATARAAIREITSHAEAFIDALSRWERDVAEPLGSGLELSPRLVAALELCREKSTEMAEAATDLTRRVEQALGRGGALDAPPSRTEA